MMTYQEAQALLKEHGQEQLLKYYDELSDKERAALLKQISSINFSDININRSSAARRLGGLSPVPALSCADVERDRQKYEAAGLAAIRAGKVAAVLLAGGQGTRLGSDAPKGT